MAITLEPREVFLGQGARIRAISSAWHAYIAVFAATCVMIGVYWDISWHMSIGRDTFWTPAHLLIQAGGLIAGISSGYVALRTTFKGSRAQRDASVTFWGFRAPLGAWACIWGCIAMLTSAPFDDWWHNAYGLDVKIISPPHTLLAFGIYSIVVGGLLLTLAQQNRARGSSRGRLAWVLALNGGLLIMNLAIFLTEYTQREQMHSAFFYYVTALVFPFALAMFARAITLRWAATAAAACFMALMLVPMWVLQFFPATPKLGPIYQDITHMVTLTFPVLIIAPAIAIDVVLRRLDGRVNVLALAAVIGPVFVATFAAVQWPFASFLMNNPIARGRLFNAENFVYWMSPSHAEMIRHFPAPGQWPIGIHLALAAVIASGSALLGLRRGAWMQKVRR